MRQTRSILRPVLVKNLTIEERIWQAKIDVHQAEALAYDQIHLEIFKGIEQ
jgi:hypothetical protein